MPHKRAKRSAREEHRQQKGANLAPNSSSNSIRTEDIPKSALRVLNAAKTRAEYRERKRKLLVEDRKEEPPHKTKRRKQNGEEDAKNAMVIKSGESLAHFNRRVEDSMRSAVRVAMKTSSSHGRKARKQEELVETTADVNPPKNPSKSSKSDQKPENDVDEHTRRPKEFAAFAPRRLHDVAMAPPQLQLKKATKLGIASTKAVGVISMAQQSMMEAEREKAIKRYRELKLKKLQEKGRSWTDTAPVDKDV